MRRDGVRAFHHEIDERVVPCDFRADDVVAARMLRVMAGLEAVRVTVTRIALIRRKIRKDVVPLREASVDIDGFRRARRRHGADALVAANEVDELVVVMVLQVAFRRFQIAAEFIGKFIREGIFDTYLAVWRPFLPTPCDPFVPAGHEHDFRVDLQRIVELLREIIAIFLRVLFTMVALRRVGAPHDVVAVHGGQIVHLVVVVVGDSDRDLLRLVRLLVRRVRVIHGLRIDGQPAPMPELRIVIHIFRKVRPIGKILRQPFVCRVIRIQSLRMGHHHRLAIPVKP